MISANNEFVLCQKRIIQELQKQPIYYKFLSFLLIKQSKDFKLEQFV